MIDQTLRLCGDFRGEGKSGRRISWEEARDAVRFVVFELARANGILKDMSVIPMVSGQDTYDLPVDCIAPLSISINGLSEGRVLFPSSVGELDYRGLPDGLGGIPEIVVQDGAEPGKIRLYPVPGTSGGSFTADSTDGVLASITDNDGGSLPYETEDALTGVSGGPYLVSGDGPIVSELWPVEGNVFLVYERTPDFPVSPDGYIDDSIPYHIHKDIPYGAAAGLIRGSEKGRYYELKWTDARLGVVSNAWCASDDMRPV
jgi:hypothetical protein